MKRFSLILFVAFACLAMLTISFPEKADGQGVVYYQQSSCGVQSMSCNGGVGGVGGGGFTPNYAPYNVDRVNQIWSQNYAHYYRPAPVVTYRRPSPYTFSYGVPIYSQAMPVYSTPPQPAGAYYQYTQTRPTGLFGWGRPITTSVRYGY